MIRGYVSSDEDDSDDYDFGYSDTLEIKKSKSPCLPPIQTEEIREKLYSTLEDSRKIDIFLNAIVRGDIAALKELISEGVSVDCTDSQGWTPLIKASGSGEFEVVQFLLEHGADPNKHRELLTPLMTCCTHTLVSEELKLNCVRLLLQHGADVNAKDKFQTTALMYAAGSGYEDIVTELLTVPTVNVNAQDKEGWTALFHAVKNNDVKLVEKLLAAGSDLKLKDKYDRTVINLALDKNFKKVATALGYVEEEIVICSQKEEPKERFLRELPDSNGQGGFFTEAQNILHCFNQFSVKDISLPDLLNATEKDLYEIGVKLKPDRFKILSKGIHRYHLHPWKKSSLPQIKPGVSMSLVEVITVLGTLAQHLTVVNASLSYLSKRISSRCNKELVDLAREKEMIISLIGSYKSAETLKVLLPKCLKHIEKMKLDIPSDYIFPNKQKNNREKFVRCFWYIVGAASAGVLIFYRPFLNFGMLLAFFFQEILPTRCISHPELLPEDIGYSLTEFP